MRFWNSRIQQFICTIVVVSVLSIAYRDGLVEATSSPSPSTVSTCTPANTQPPSVFGVPKGNHKSSPSSATAAQSTTTTTTTTTTPALFHMRGGELHSPETVDEVDALVMNAGSNGQLVVIDFTASWCGPCKMIAPLFKEMSEDIEDVVFLKVDVDENPETAAKYSVSAMPTFIFIKSGEVVDRLMGANVQRLQELIQEHM